MKGKPPAFQFYVRDWLSDPQLRMASHDTKGVWIDLLCFMWEAPERGQLIGTAPELARMVGATDEVFGIFLNEAQRLKFADVTFCNNEVTLINRRMARDQKNRNNTRLRVAKYRSNAPCNEKVTPPSSSSSSSSSFSKKKKSTPLPPKRGDCPHQEIIKIYHDTLPQLPRIQVWNDANKKTLGARWKEDPGRQTLDWWTDYFKTVSQSDFLMGRSKTDWQCPGLSWLIGPKNMSKVLNGHYRNKVKPGESPEELARQERVDRLMIGDEEYDKIQKAKDGL